MAYPHKENNYWDDHREQRKKKAGKKAGKLKISRVLLWGIIGYLLFSFSNGFYQGYKLKKEINSLKEQLDVVEAENARLLEELEYIQTPEAIEKIAREKLGLIRPGEIMIMKAREPQQ